ncbi:MAG: DNA polymerase III subunit delta [Planctomycetaceae bacterium]
MHATEFLSKQQTVGVPVCVLFGGERFLKLEVLKRIPGCSEAASDADDEVTLSRFDGSDVELRSVTDELLTVSMFGDRRIVLVEDADDFVSKYRAGLEKYVADPSRSALLILDVKTWQKSTKLFKAVEKIGLNIECSELKGAALTKWLVNAAQEQYGKTLDAAAANLIVQLAGDSLGLLQQELDKLASLTGDASAITQEDVTRVVGGWRIETTWAMLDAVRDGALGQALEYLDKLIIR